MRGSRVPYGIVGDGRMARHMARYLELSGLPVRQWARTDGTAIGETLGGCDPILILVSDAAIAEVGSELREESDATLVHFSGSLTLPGMAGMHPLSTFGPDLYILETYRVIPFVCEAGAAAFGEVFPELPNPRFTIDPSRKPLYHALAALAGNVTTALWGALFARFEDALGLPREAALPYLDRIAANLAAGAGEPLTGPVARGDRATVAANLAALEGDPLREVYRAFVQALDPSLLEEDP